MVHASSTTGQVSSSPNCIDAVAPSSSRQTRHRSIATKRDQGTPLDRAVERFPLAEFAKKSPQSLSSLTCRETAGFSTSRGSNHSTSIARRRRKAYRRESNQGLLTDSGTGHPRRARPARCSISLLQRLVKTGQFSRCSEKVSSSAPLIDTVAPSSSLQTRHRSIAIKRVERKASKKAVARFSLTDSAKGSTQSKSSLSCRKSVAFSVSQGSNHSIPAIRGPRKACRRKTKQVPPTDSGSGPLRRARPARSRDFYH